MGSRDRPLTECGRVFAQFSHHRECSPLLGALVFFVSFFCDPVVVVIRLPSRHYRLLALLLAATIIEAKFAEPKFAAIIG